MDGGITSKHWKALRTWDDDSKKSYNVVLPTEIVIITQTKHIYFIIYLPMCFKMERKQESITLYVCCNFKLSFNIDYRKRFKGSSCSPYH